MTNKQIKSVDDLLQEYLDRMYPVEFPTNSCWGNNKIGRNAYKAYVENKRKEVTPISWQDLERLLS